MAPSRTRSERSTSTVKSTCPGVSMMLIRQSRQKDVVAAEVPWNLHGDDGLGGLDETFSNGYEDDDFCLRAREHGAQFGVEFLQHRIWGFCRRSKAKPGDALEAGQALIGILHRLPLSDSRTGTDARVSARAMDAPMRPVPMTRTGPSTAPG